MAEPRKPFGVNVQTALMLWLTWLLLFVVPFLIAFGLGSYLFYAQHNFPGVSFACNKDWAYDKAALESSSYMQMNPVMHWFTANIGVHHVHHMNSRIPYYRLQQVLRDHPELKDVGRLTLMESFRTIRLALWCETRKKLVPCGIGLHGIWPSRHRRSCRADAALLEAPGGAGAANAEYGCCPTGGSQGSYNLRANESVGAEN